MRIMCCGARTLRWRGAEDDGLLARPDRPSRWTLPITALRVMFPSSAAIWLAERPDSHKFLSCSTRSSVQFITVIGLFLLCRTGSCFWFFVGWFRIFLLVVFFCFCWLV